MKKKSLSMNQIMILSLTGNAVILGGLFGKIEALRRAVLRHRR